jgi:hypothetical protein
VRVKDAARARLEDGEVILMVQVRSQTDDAGTPTIDRRVGGEIETVGVAPVPDKQRVQTPRQMFVVWLMASASATTPLIGAVPGWWTWPAVMPSAPPAVRSPRPTC